MGIGFDVFKANIGWSLADSLMGSVSNAIEKNAAENAARAQAEKEQADKNDMLKTLVFMVGNNIALDRAGKKSIASVLSTVYDENISLFSIEDKIDAAYSELKSENLKQFFSEIAAINTDREQTCFMYVVIMILYIQLSDEKLALPVHAYNLSLIKKFFAINRSELSQCYTALGEKLGKDIDDVADVFEELTSEESIKKIEAENPTLVHDDQKPALPERSVTESPKDKVEECYKSSVHGTAAELSEIFFLADTNPKKVLAAVNAYAKNCKGEEILALYDDSVFGNGKVGFLLSNKKLYVCNSFEKPQEIELASVDVVSEIPETFLINVSGVKISTQMAFSINKSYKGLLCDFLKKAIPLAMQVEVAK